MFSVFIFLFNLLESCFFWFRIEIYSMKKRGFYRGYLGFEFVAVVFGVVLGRFGYLMVVVLFLGFVCLLVSGGFYLGEGMVNILEVRLVILGCGLRFFRDRLGGVG